MAEIGVQMMMLREHVQREGAFAVLRRLKEMGFRSVEISAIQLDEQTVTEFQKAIDELGTRVAAMSVSTLPGSAAQGSLADNFESVVAQARRLNVKNVRLAALPLPALQRLESIVDFARTAERMAKALNHEGLQLSYHNHHMEFARIDGRYILDWIRSEAPSLHFEIDVYWTQRGGLDPVRVLADYAGLVDLVHLKDYRIGVPSDDAFAALAAGDQETWSQHWNQLAQFAEVGHGNLDFPAIIEQAVASGAQHLIIEQDEQYGRDIYDCLADSRANLSQMGYESMF